MRGKNFRGAVLGGALAAIVAVGAMTACSSEATGHSQALDPVAAASTPTPGSSETSAPAETPTASPTPTAAPAPPAPPTVVQTEHVGEQSEQAAAELTQQGMLVAFADASGNPLPAVSEWSVVGMTPAAGLPVPVGSTVRLTLQAPAPPPPPPAPAAPAPAPADPDPAPAPAVPGGGATALCNDGTLSYSAHHQGTCSHHGGVAVWYR